MASKVHYVDSDKRIEPNNSTSHDFSYELKIPSNHTKVSISQISIPKSFYLVQTNKNSFILEENQAQIICYIPIGNFSANQFKTTLQTVLNNSGAYTYVVSLNTNTGKFTYVCSNNGGIQPKLIMTSPLFKLFGFNADSTNTFVADTITSTNVINFSISSVYLLSDICVLQKQQLSDNVLQEVFSFNSRDFSHISFVNNQIQLTAKTISNVNNTKFNFKLTDTDSNLLDLNGNELVFSLVTF